MSNYNVYKYLSIFTIFLSILTLASCKLFITDDIAPLVNFTIVGGNEISRDVTLYLDINDDSNIDKVSVIIDDSTYSTNRSNFDTIRFTVNELGTIKDFTMLDSLSVNGDFEQDMYVRVTDEEGNVGVSEKHSVVITDFPGWKKYGKIEDAVNFLKIDENDRLWISTYYSGINIFDTNEETLSRIYLEDLNIEIDGLILDRYFWVVDLAVIDGSRVWMILFEGYAIEYHYDLNRIIKTIKLPSTERVYFSIAVDNNYDIWMGGLGILHYNHVEFDQNYIYPNSNILYTNEVHEVILDKNDELYICNEHSPHLVSYKNGIFTDLNAPSFVGYGGGLTTVMDSLGNIWMAGLSKYDGNSWQTIQPNPLNNEELAYPMMVAKDNTLYLRIENNAINDQYGQSGDIGIATYKDEVFEYWNTFDSPFALQNNTEFGYFHSWREKPIVETENGDIWMIIDNTLWRYRPSLGGYP